MTRRLQDEAKMEFPKCSQEELFWQQCLGEALFVLDIDKIKTLVEEGLTKSYSFEKFKGNTFVSIFLKRVQN